MLKVLIAEDNLILADILELSLQDGGYEVCGIACTVAEAITLADQHEPNLGVFDFRLADGGFGSQIRQGLLGNPALAILYVSADHLDDLLTKADGDAYIQKPYSVDDLLAALKLVLAIKTGGQSPEVIFPKNFHVLKDPDNSCCKIA